MIVRRPSADVSGLGGGRTWWAHFEFTRINIEPTILRKKIEDLRVVRARLAGTGGTVTTPRFRVRSSPNTNSCHPWVLRRHGFTHGEVGRLVLSAPPALAARTAVR